VSVKKNDIKTGVLLLAYLFIFLSAQTPGKLIFYILKYWFHVQSYLYISIFRYNNKYNFSFSVKGYNSRQAIVDVDIRCDHQYKQLVIVERAYLQIHRAF
jgi:hypothetical protein